MAMLEDRLKSLVQGFGGRVGVGVQSASQTVFLRGSERFAMQSVMKLVVAATVMDSVDRRGWHLDDPILVRREDLSLNVQPLAKLVTAKGYRTTIGDLVARAVIDSDSAATDILWARVGGAPRIGSFLARTVGKAIRVDRDERHLQTEITGLTWRPEYTDARVLEQAIRAVPPAKRAQAFTAYLHDERDTATPQGMTSFIHRLATGALLSPTSTAYLLSVMYRTATGPDRLKAGVAPGWRLAHKTGTGPTYRGLNTVSNDVGILTAANKEPIALSVFVAESRRADTERAALIAQIARIVLDFVSNSLHLGKGRRTMP